MKSIQVNGLTIGEIPRVVGTISSRECLSEFPTACRDFCDIAEVRLDEIGQAYGWVNACNAIEAVGIPAMVTLRSRSEGGKCDRSDEERLEVFRQATTCSSIIDVEFNSNLAQRARQFVTAANKVLLVSYHDFQKTPSLSALSDVVQRAGEHADIVKISTMVNSDDDLDVLRDLLDAGSDRPLCVIGMGYKGTRSRTTFPCIGSSLTYGFLDSFSAPGQLPARMLVDHLRSVYSKYNEEFIIRHELMEFV